ncbi:MAG: ABC transporter ATP-binding protein [Verrucomicrobiota bacterium]|jgi:lipopolysaccharide transport system ATP-binding protein
MSDTVINVENLSKKYVLGKNGSSNGLKHVIHDVATAPLRWLRNSASGAQKPEINGRKAAETFWALKDVSFEIKRGEVVGIIGRNGAGKSTLLKILSRITEQTQGRVEITGRVASLLEVGTGFHPELSGRENIFLNGAILGMGRQEIKKKFDEIVAFAEVEQFLDTPVKRYSSGMYVRLAFAVAAHLEPEILIVDEVLAVGDAQFQNKCLGKMQEVGKSGRTVLFVSHNIEAVLKLCTRGILLAKGNVFAMGEASKVTSIYFEDQISSAGKVDLHAKPRTLPGNGTVQLVGALPLTSQKVWSYPFGRPLALLLHLEARKAIGMIELGIGLFSARGFEVASWSSTCAGSLLSLKTGLNTVHINFNDLKLLPGRYYLGLGVRSERGFEDYIPEAVWFEVVVSDESAKANAHTMMGTFVPNVEAKVVV